MLKNECDHNKGNDSMGFCRLCGYQIAEKEETIKKKRTRRVSDKCILNRLFKKYKF